MTSLELGKLATNGTLDRIERLGKIIQAFGVPLMLAIFVAWYAGWIPSPLLTSIQATLTSVEAHDRRVAGVIVTRGESDRQFAETLKLLTLQLRQQTRVLQLIGCSAVKEPDLRRKCLDE